MVYEANARIRDPVYGCAGAICQLQKQVSELQAQLARAQAELVTMQAQHAHLIALVCMEMAQSQQQCIPSQPVDSLAAGAPHVDAFYLDADSSHGSIWEEPLWTLSWVNVLSVEEKGFERNELWRGVRTDWLLYGQSRTTITNSLLI